MFFKSLVNQFKALKDKRPIFVWPIFGELNDYTVHRPSALHIVLKMSYIDSRIKTDPLNCKLNHGFSPVEFLSCSELFACCISCAGPSPVTE